MLSTRTMSPPRVDPSPAPEAAVRLQKVLAGAGVGSRRACDELIAAGRVTVNGRTAAVGSRVDPQHDVVQVDGATVVTAVGLVHLAVNKPLGVISAMSAADGRPCVADLLESLTAPGLHHVGRLDADSEGLLLVTNDGALSNRLTHPSYGVTKRYLVELDGTLSRAVSRSLVAGVELDDGVARFDELDVVDATARRTLVEVALHEGRNRIVRRMFDATGHPVRRLVRIAVGPIRLGELRPGRFRHLNRGEVQALYSSVGL